MFIYVKGLIFSWTHVYCLYLNRACGEISQMMRISVPCEKYTTANSEWHHF